MKSIFRDALILFLITAAAGVLLAVVNEMTKEPIAAQKKAAEDAACREVFADAANFVLDADPAEVSAYAEWQAEYPKDVIDKVYSARGADGQYLGVVINVTNKEGYGGNIRFSMGVRADGTLNGTLNGISILETSETPGLGLQAAEVLVPQLRDRHAEQFRYVKGGGASAADEIDAISSATITTRAFVNGINAGLAYYRMVYAGHTAESERDAR